MILHIDMDSFYASIEVREDPELAGLPVIVGADPKEGTGRGVVMTASYEARTFGVRSAMPISRAWHLCPHGVYLLPRFPLYVRVSQEIMTILSRYAPGFEPVSIDEAYMDITGTGSYAAAWDLAGQIKAEIMREERLTCSIGIGPGKTVAKIASGYCKPDGLTVVEPEHVREFLSPLPVHQIPGIGRKTAAILHGMDISTIGQLAEADAQALVSRFGKGGIALRMLAQGEDDREVRPRDYSRSISREYTFPEDTRDPALLISTLDAMAETVHSSLREEGLRFRTVTVKVRDEGFVTRTKSRSLTHYSCDPGRIRSLARSLLSECCSDARIRLIGIRLSCFERKSSDQRTIADFYREEKPDHPASMEPDGTWELVPGRPGLSPHDRKPRENGH